VARYLLCLLLVLTAACNRGDLIPLGGTWDFKKGFDQKDLTDPSRSGWDTVKLPASITETKNLQGYAGWITLRKELPPESADILSRGAAAINMGWTSDVSYYYINGQLIGQVGSAQPYETGLFRRFIKEIPQVPAKEKNYLVIAVYGTGEYPLQFDTDAYFGPGESVFNEYFQNEVVSFFLLGIYFVVGAYHLLLFSRRPQDKHNLLFGIFCTLLTLYWLNRTGSRDPLFGSHVIARLRIEYISLFFIPPSLMFFLSQFFYRRFSRVGLAVFAVCLVLAVITLFAPYTVAKNCLTVWQYSSIVAIGYAIFYILREAFKKNQDARWLALGVIVLMIAALHDIAAARHWINSTHIARYAFLIFVLAIAAILANRFMRVHTEVEQLNEKLEDKVRVRTQQLTESLDEVQKLKIQQDGDYFLTSLLIQPLTGNFVKSQNVSVDMLLRQKKQFQFRHWQAEIGGDLCIAQSISLRRRTYTVFLNGDAMGKSIQGAGGALVLGTVFKSMVSRTQLAEAAQNKAPEQWLKECFVELQNVFVSFDGSMMVSAVFGLVDEESGMLYYINAEHPFVVLYREKKAEFLENDMQLRKLGVSGLGGHLEVKTYQLLPNDVVIIGSDGRDDVQIGVDRLGNRIINENEMEFLRHVEKGDSDLRRIEKSIMGFGQLTDDFTMLRIGFKEAAAQQRSADADQRIAAFKAEVRKARGLFNDGATDEAIFVLEQAMDMTEENADAMRLLVKIMIQAGMFDRAANLSDSYTRRFPADTEFLYITSYAYAKSGETRQAIEFAERCRLRDPSMVRNLTHLARLHAQTGNEPLARRVLGEALQVDPLHAKARQMLAAIED